MRSLAYIFLLFLLIPAVAVSRAHTPTQIEDDWEVASPDSVGIDTKSLIHLSQVIRRKHSKVDSIVIARHNRLIYEKYFNEGKQKKPHDLASARKSIVSILIGLAIDQQKIKSSNQSIYELFPYKQYKNWDDRKKSLKLRHLLTMTPGWECGGWGLSTKNKCGPIMFKQKQPFKWVLDLPMESEPGAHFSYSDAAPAVLRAAIMLSTQQLYLDFYYNALLKPLSIKRPKNISVLTSRDMTKIGQLFLNMGRWKDRQIISEAWVKESTSTQYQFKDSSQPFNSAKGYGYFWWIGEFDVNGESYSYYSAAGNGGQYIFVLPSLDLVVVMTGQYYGKSAPGQELMSKFIIPSISKTLAQSD